MNKVFFYSVVDAVAGRTNAAEARRKKERAVLISVWGDRCELRMAALWSVAALPRTDRL